MLLLLVVAFHRNNTFLCLCLSLEMYGAQDSPRLHFVDVQQYGDRLERNLALSFNLKYVESQSVPGSATALGSRLIKRQYGNRGTLWSSSLTCEIKLTNSTIPHTPRWRREDMLQYSDELEAKLSPTTPFNINQEWALPGSAGILGSRCIYGIIKAQWGALLSPSPGS